MFEKRVFYKMMSLWIFKHPLNISLAKKAGNASCLVSTNDYSAFG